MFFGYGEASSTNRDFKRFFTALVAPDWHRIGTVPRYTGQPICPDFVSLYVDMAGFVASIADPAATELTVSSYVPPVADPNDPTRQTGYVHQTFILFVVELHLIRY